MDDFYDELEEDYSEDVTTMTSLGDNQDLEDDLDILNEQEFQPLEDDIELDSSSSQNDLIADPDEEDLNSLESMTSDFMQEEVASLEASEDELTDYQDELAWQDASPASQTLVSDEDIAKINQALLKVSLASKLQDALGLSKNVIASCVESGVILGPSGENSSEFRVLSSGVKKLV